MAHPDEVRKWFKEHFKFVKAMYQETSIFLNQKAQIAAALVESQSKESFTKNLQQILQLLQAEEDQEGRQDPNSSTTSSSDYNQNEDDCFRINLQED
ncbi:uncharacterized protein DS421_16g540640 [Arachis hypogaea]|nr:uncharacterized protein DS421_16g540640 [Arachis hypogaea]